MKLFCNFLSVLDIIVRRGIWSCR